MKLNRCKVKSDFITVWKLTDIKMFIVNRKILKRVKIWKDGHHWEKLFIIRNDWQLTSAGRASQWWGSRIHRPVTSLGNIASWSQLSLYQKELRISNNKTGTQSHANSPQKHEVGKKSRDTLQYHIQLINEYIICTTLIILELVVVKCVTCITIFANK